MDEIFHDILPQLIKAGISRTQICLDEAQRKPVDHIEIVHDGIAVLHQHGALIPYVRLGHLSVEHPFHIPAIGMPHCL